MKKIIPLIILTFFLIIIGGILFIQNQNLKKEIGILNDKIAELEKPAIITPTPIAEKPPEGWKVYTDDEYKFKIWYPKEFYYDNIIKKIQISKVNYKGVEGVLFSGLIPNDVSVGLMGIYIYINENVDLINFLKIYIKNEIEFFPNIKAEIKKTTNAQYNGNDIVQYNILYEKNLDKYITQHITQTKSQTLDLYKFGVSGELIRYLVEKNGQIILFRYDTGEAQFIPELDKTVEQMIQSFQFID